MSLSGWCRSTSSIAGLLAYKVALGDKHSSRVVGRAVEDLALPAGTTIGAIVREDDVIIAHHDTVIREHDHVLLFVPDKAQIPAIERLFHVSATFV